jgi:hypothetical protein
MFPTTITLGEMMKRVPGFVIGAVGAAGMALAGAVSTNLQVKIVPAPTPIITFEPAAPTIKDDVPKGTLVATATVTMEDGSPVPAKTGASITAQMPSGIFAVTKIDAAHYRVVIDPAGPGINKGPATNLVTVRADTTATP